MNACEAFWKEYVSQLPTDHPHRGTRPDVFAFGAGGALADELAALVLSGKKRATTSLAVEFTSVNEPLPHVGSLSIILRGDLTPVAIIERTDVRTLPFQDVDEAYAATEGEGDGSLAYWRAAHTQYFAGVCERLGGHFDHKTPVICQIFRVAWPTPDLRLPATTSS